MQKTKVKFRSNRIVQKLQPLHIPENSFNQKFQNNLIENFQEINNDEKRTQQDNNSDAVTIKRRRQSDPSEDGRERISTEENVMNVKSKIDDNLELNGKQSQMMVPYEFIGVSQPSFRTIILPHFSFKTITFSLNILMLLTFLTIFVIHQIKPQTDLSWGCMLFNTQNKFYPKLRVNYEFWRVLVSGFFHSNFSHLILNLVGMQLYGYFVEWYLGKWKFVGLILTSMVNSHFMSCLTNPRTIGTTASGVLYGILGVKIMFFIKYRNYEQLNSKKYALYGLLGIVFGINLIVLFVGSNVDIGGHVGGLLSGLVYGGIFYWKSDEIEGDSEEIKKRRIARYGLIAGLVLLTFGLIGSVFAIQISDIDEANTLVDSIC